MLLLGLLNGMTSPLYQVIVHGTVGGWTGPASSEANAITQALAYFGITGNPTTICSAVKLSNIPGPSGLLTIVNVND